MLQSEISIPALISVAPCSTPVSMVIFDHANEGKENYIGGHFSEACLEHLQEHDP